ncbi:MAG: LuxR C-terminal-related transcriptional regulator [Phycisphaerales bacterium]
MRVIHACEAVAMMRDPATGQETVYAACRTGRLETPRYNTLRKWPSNTCSLYWRGNENTSTDQACLLKPEDAAHAAVCQEVARELAAPEINEDIRCLGLTLSCKPICKALFVRLAPRPPFEERDSESIMRFTAQASYILQQSFYRDQNDPDIDSPPLQFVHNTSDISQLLDQLSSTEHRVLQRLRLNETERQVALSLGRSPNTVHVHVKSIYRKLRVTSRKQLLKLLSNTQDITAPVIRLAANG